MGFFVSWSLLKKVSLGLWMLIKAHWNLLMIEAFEGLPRQWKYFFELGECLFEFRWFEVCLSIAEFSWCLIPYAYLLDIKCHEAQASIETTIRTIGLCAQQGYWTLSPHPLRNLLLRRRFGRRWIGTHTAQNLPGAEGFSQGECWCCDLRTIQTFLRFW